MPRGEEPGQFWHSLLLAPDRHDLDGHILFPCTDEALEFIGQHREELQRRYIIENTVPALQRDALDKKRTLELARSVGVPAPGFWSIEKVEDLDAIRDQVRFPVMVKPIHSHKFQRVFHSKLFIVEDGFEELAAKVRLAREKGIEVMVVEMIPGADDLLSSYYTYIDDAGRKLFHYTKRVLRRYPVNRGMGCYHITEWLPETADLGQKFFDGIGWRALACIEFKRDTRDGELKVIEVNSRFTAAHELVVRSGAPIDLIVYCALTGQPGPRYDDYDQHLRLWHPVRDFQAFRELNRRGELSFLGWLKSVLFHRKVLPFWSMSDPLPSLAVARWWLARVARRLHE
jgi:predicted ATP-grasp superfamily ATP-dependent carboligase